MSNILIDEARLKALEDAVEGLAKGVKELSDEIIKALGPESIAKIMRYRLGGRYE